MNIRNLTLSYYQNASDNMHIHRVEKATDGLNPHTHSHFQIYYIIRGELTHFIGDTSSRLMRGDMSIVPPGCIHHVGETLDAVFYRFSFAPDFLGDLSASNRLAGNFLQSLLRGDHPLRPKVAVPPEKLMSVEHLMEQILQEFSDQQPGCGEIIRSYAVVLICLLARLYLDAIPDKLPPRFESNRQLILHCIRYIENHFTEPLTLEETTRELSISRSSFCRLFLTVSGCTFTQYLNRCRIEQACRHIQNGHKITSVHELCGYTSFSTFYRNFYSVMGISPREYLKQLKQNGHSFPAPPP